MAAPRRFDPITIRAEGGPRRVHRITCSECPATYDVSANTHCGARAKEDLYKVFARGGWEVGSTPSGDLCHACVLLRRASRRAKPDHTTKSGEDDMTNVHVTSPVKLVPDAPPEMSRDEKRLIFAKLNDVYLDETKGYDAGWTDQRVATDLGVPRAWVERVRDENFGPARDNEDIRAALAEWREVGAKVEDLKSRAVALTTESAKVAAELRELIQRHDRLAKRVTEIEKTTAL